MLIQDIKDEPLQAKVELKQNEIKQAEIKKTAIDTKKKEQPKKDEIKKIADKEEGKIGEYETSVFMEKKNNIDKVEKGNKI